MKKLTIGHLYPDLLNLYGDRGNIQCFRKRLEWRGMEAEVIPFLSGEKIDFSKLDIVLLGGGSDREQELVCGFLKDIKDDFNPRRFKDAVKGNAQFYHAQVGSQVASGEGKGVNEGIPDFFRKPGQFRLRDFHQVCVAADACQQFRKIR